jgi:hypothetical protein
MCIRFMTDLIQEFFFLILPQLIHPSRPVCTQKSSGAVTLAFAIVYCAELQIADDLSWRTRGVGRFLPVHSAAPPL